MTKETSAGRSDEQSNTTSSTRSKWPVGRIIAVLVVLSMATIVGLGVYWSRQPETFDISQIQIEGMDIKEALKTPGVATVSSAINVAETLLEKPGGYISNDITPPGILIDNMPNWEYGALTELRDSVRSLRNDFSRSQTQSIENNQLKLADSDFNFDSNSYMLPSTESQYRDGINALKEYRAALIAGTDQTARFYTRADNLRAYLMVVEKRLGSYAQRLSASVNDAELTAAFTEGGAQILEATAWTEVDDIFYEARGYTWALLHMIQAISVDFESVLKGKNATVSVEQIMRDLRGAAMRKWSPMVLNGHGYGLLANHSLVMASYISRANAAVIDLRMLLENG
ncbi:DUF2333 family protein [Thiorhodovibrio frisius]|uniref:DUF2333 domain-containing protein n=1 Tax=Thiorhodovibrio frisius TaxID=631362 RepID=H8Z233_9GAMM|nr:DUF2333 family protein [Thiorhodovibrio frisius]EIC21558.1 hypothetical protein Thi970DRAFT_01771 [Thiorhodovibrio frisius]WPL24142.1 hypothetical protein Thiofri_04356 [Thiorhodovibrio frisius]